MGHGKLCSHSRSLDCGRFGDGVHYPPRSPDRPHRTPVALTVRASKVRRPSAIYGTALALSVVTILVSYVAFRWLLISYQTWRLGHPNPFVMGPETDAMLLSLLAATIVFWLVVKGAKRKSKPPA